MTANQRQKAEIKERIRKSNEVVKNGLPPDEWVVQFRAKNNAIKAAWKAKQPKKEPKPKVANSGSFKKGLIPKNKKDEAHKKKSLERWRANCREWQKKNKERINKLARVRRQNNIGVRIKCNLRKRLSFLFRKYATEKTTQTMAALGCSMPFFLDYIQGLFSEGMTLKNYGEWHLDHKIPCDSFDFTNKEDVMKCFHYTNIQPLWALDNRIKSNRVLFADA